ncbi:glycosyltransferase family 17 protein [Lasiosphaeris hirsuta]|uniref:Glycosyltransferase family 17 protein n=1 Tax=Lasiosphaeris hirsuta TaxID=260670 RepID=A0AA40BBH2_9PEZI|nr:glycosyltransferase family 17 protein [Lasiosphaeris hirsuta]
MATPRVSKRVKLAAAAAAAVWGLFHLTTRGSNIHALSASEISWSPKHDRHDICRTYGWRRYNKPPSEPPRKVYDLVMVSTELDWLEIHLNSTFDAVDYFVLMEGRKTFTGLEKSLTLKGNMNRFAAYESKIIYHEMEYPLDFEPHTVWDIEDLQRNSMLTQVFPRLEGAQTPGLGDVIVVTDVDEIPRPSTLVVLRECHFPRRLTLRSKFYYYSFQNLHRGEEWPHPQATYYQGDHTVKPNDLRMGLGFFLTLWWDRADLWNASWHCSSCFSTIEELLLKVQSFSQTHLNGPDFRNKTRIVEHVRAGQDIWERESETCDRIENNTDIPRFLLNNQDKYRYVLDRDGKSAGFSDFEDTVFS